jgi:hypothetical protein
MDSDAEFDHVIAQLQQDTPPEVVAPAFTVETQPPKPEPKEEIILHVRNKLGFKDEKWDRVKRMMVNELVKVEDVRFVVKTLVIGGLDSLEKIERAMEVAVELMERPAPAVGRGKYTPEYLADQTKIAAGQIMANCGKAWRDLAAQVTTMVEKTAEKRDQQEKKFKNRPPAVAVQVNNYPQNHPQNALPPPNGNGAINGSIVESAD